MTVALILALVASGLTPDGTKIDERVSARFAQNRPQAVFVMMADQFLPPKAFDAWAKTNMDGDRLKLRIAVVAKLKKRLKATKRFGLEVLGEDADIRPVWLVNGFGAELKKKELEELAERNEVMYIYPVSRLPRRVQSGKSPVARPVSGRGQATSVPWNVERVGARRVHEELKLTGKGSVVAMFESGVNLLHKNLQNAAWINVDEVPNNGVDDDGNGYIDDYHGFDFARMTPNVLGAGGRGSNHGTMTSGIVAGWSDTKAIAVAPGAKIMPVSTGGPFGTLLALQYAIENGADVVNMSFSIPNLGHTRGLWRLAAEHATAAGLVLVSGAGNFQRQQRIPVQQRIPEGIPCVISAGGVDRDLKVPGFCSLGPVEWSKVRFYEDYPMPDGLVKPDVCGFPGAGYPILDPNKPEGGLIDPNNGVRGNSFSGPHVTGVVALMFEANPKLTAMKVKRILESTAKDIAPKGKDNRTGAGLLNAYEAVKAAKVLAR